VIHLHSAARSESTGQGEHCRGRALELAQQAIRQVKSMSFQLRPAQLELLGFAAAVQATLDRQLEASGVRGSMRLRGRDPQRAASAQAVALRVLQEALTNVVRHAGATQVWVRISVLGERLSVVLADNGRGFDMSERRAGADGLANMTERLKSLRGDCNISSNPQKGTTVRFQAPLPKRLL
jgi:signal transduction histidine kinase